MLLRKAEGKLIDLSSCVGFVSSFFCCLQRHVLPITAPVLDVFEFLYRFSGENESYCRVMKEDTVLPSKNETFSRKDFTIIMINLVICWLVIKLAFKERGA